VHVMHTKLVVTVFACDYGTRICVNTIIQVMTLASRRSLSFKIVLCEPNATFRKVMSLMFDWKGRASVTYSML
jgi:hypothetical protein